MAPKGAVGRKAVRTSFMMSKTRKKAGCNDKGRTSDVAVVGSLDHANRKEDTEVTKSDGCSTPKADRYKIPAIGTCPPAPKKRSPRCLLWRKGRRPRPSFASPDIEMFFFDALGVGGLSV